MVLLCYASTSHTHTRAHAHARTACLAQANAAKSITEGPHPLINRATTKIIQAFNVPIATIFPEECPTTPCEEISEVFFSVECLVFWGLHAVCIAEFNCHP